MKLSTVCLMATSVTFLVIATLIGISTLDDQEAKTRVRGLENSSDKNQESPASAVKPQNPFEREFGQPADAGLGKRVTIFRKKTARQPVPLDSNLPSEDTAVPGGNMLPVTFVQTNQTNDDDVPPDFFSIDSGEESNSSAADSGVNPQRQEQGSRPAESDKPEPDTTTRWMPIDQSQPGDLTPETSEYFDLTGQSRAGSTATAEVSRQQSDEHRQWLLSLASEDPGPSSTTRARRSSVRSVSSEFNGATLQLSDRGSRYQPAPLQVESLVDGRTLTATGEPSTGNRATVSDHRDSGQRRQNEIVNDNSLRGGERGLRIARNPGQSVRQTIGQASASPQPNSTEHHPSRETTVDAVLDKQPEKVSGPPPKEATREIVGWPLPESLLPELDHLEKFQATSKWAEAARSTYQKLNQLELSDPASLPLTMHCEQLAGQLDEYSRQLLQSDAQYFDSCMYMSRVAYRMERRAKIWKQVHLLAVRQLEEAPERNGQIVAQQILSRSREINIDNIDPLWADYLMLRRAEEIFADSRSSQARKQAIARKILARVTSKSLDQDQSLYAQQLIGEQLGDVLRSAAIGELDLGKFLSDIEGHESKPSTSSIARLNSHFQNFYWSRDDDVQFLSDTLDNHYRNANVRLEFSQRLLNQMIPSGQTSFQQPVKDRILGANVLGHSRITNQIHLQLVPDPEHLSFRLQSDGRVLSRTRAHARGFVFSNLGNALVNASKTIAVGADGISLAPTDVRASSRNRVTDIKSNVDGVPIVGWLARRMAHQQQQSQDHQAKQIVDQKLRNEFRQRVDDEIQQRVTQARQWVQTNVLRPLNTMELEPTVVRLQTTADSAIVRYRLAGLDQNAADTPRPQPKPGCLASFQMHRSAVNNIINRIHINGKKFTPGEFAEHLNVLLGRDDLGIPEGQHDDVQFEFAGRDAIQLDFRENRVAISLRLKKLAIGKFGRWRNLTVTAHYTPTTTGAHVFMRFDEQKGLSVRGYKLKLPDQLAVRTVFSTLFKPEFDFSLLPPEVASRPAIQGIGISQVILSDGWLGISLDLENQSENTSPASEPLESSSALTAYTISDQAGYRQYAVQHRNGNGSTARQTSQVRSKKEYRFRHWR